MMLEFGQILGLLSAVVLFAALVAWAKLGWNRVPNPIHGRSEPDFFAPAESTSGLILLALGLSAVAAIFAVGGWIGL